MSGDTREAALIDELRYALSLIEGENWLVLLCPDPQVLAKARLDLAVLVPTDASFSGRTALLPGKGRLSLAVEEDPIFVPDSESFSLALLGWGAKNDYKGGRTWQTRCNQLVTLAH